MAEDSDLEKTEQPSERRLSQAREEGQIARSRELTTFAMMLASGCGLWFMGGMINDSLLKLVREGLTLNVDLMFKPELLMPHFYALAISALVAFLPFLLLLLAVSLFAPMIMSGWLFSLKSLEPKFSKLDPIAGIGRMFSSHGLIELAKAVIKSVFIGGIGAWAIWHNRDAVMILASEPLTASIPHLGALTWDCFLAIMAGLFLIAAVDVPFQLYDHNKKLMMTKEELRQESKETEGNPEVKGRIRSMQREMARRRMMAAIPTADVVVTNPTHYAVALRYSENGMRAPTVVAKGSHLLALRIREIAAANNVPVLEAPPLARALHKHCELEQSIPEALYVAVAEVLAYVYQLRVYQKSGGSKPRQPGDLPVPSELDPGAEALPDELDTVDEEPQGTTER